MLQRNVTVRQVSWGDNEEALLQVFKDASVAPVQQFGQILKRKIQTLMLPLERGNDSDSDSVESAIRNSLLLESVNCRIYLILP